jgi:rhamnose transport system permease protein
MTRWLVKLATAPQAITLLLIVIALAIGAAMSPRFLDAAYLLDKTSLTVPLGLMAIAMTFVICAGQIDLSVASGAVLVMVVAAKLFDAGVPMPVVIPIALLLGMLLGLVNGLGVVLLKLPALVFTLGTLALYRGVAQVLIEERTIGGFPQWFTGFDYIKIAKLVPMPLLILLCTAGVAWAALSLTTFGRKVISIGTNEEASRYSAIATDRVKVAVFVLSGLSMGAAALVMMSMLRTVDHKQFRGGELIAITAVVLGGTSIFGGRGSVVGTVLAWLLLVVVQSAMGITNTRAENQLAVVGTLLIAAVLLGEGSRRLAARYDAYRRSRMMNATA